jgi:hypothetical protein
VSCKNRAIVQGDVREGVRGDLRALLPGVEPERGVTDWGRSERTTRAFDRTLLQFLYEHWFAVRANDVANVPPDGGAVLVCSGRGPGIYHAAMVVHAIAHEHPRQRQVQVATVRHFSGVPGLGMLVAKLGGVSAHPENLQRLLFDERELVLVFAAEGVPFREAAMRAGVPIVAVEMDVRDGAIPLITRLSMPWLPAPCRLEMSFSEPVEPARLTAGS